MTILPGVSRNLWKNLQPYQHAKIPKILNHWIFVGHMKVTNISCFYEWLIIRVFENSWAFVRNIEIMVGVSYLFYSTAIPRLNNLSSKTSFTYAIKMDYPVGDRFFRRVDAVGLVGKIFFYIIPADMVLKKPYLVLCKIAELYENYAFWAICQNVIKCSIIYIM